MAILRQKFKLRDTDGSCLCVQGSEDQHHVVYIRTRYGDLELALRRNGKMEPKQMEKAMIWAEEAMEIEVVEEDTNDSADEELD